MFIKLIDKKDTCEYFKRKKEVSSPFFFIQSIEIKNIILIKVEYSVIYTIFKRIIRKIKIFVDNRKKVYYTNKQLIEYVPHKVSEVEVAIFISRVIESVGLDEIT